MKCVECKHCIGMYENQYMCAVWSDEIELIDECVANDDNQPCELYVADLDDDN